MTLKTAVRQWIMEKIKNSGWHQKIDSIPSEHPHIVLFDAPTWLYRAQFSSDGGKRMDLNQLIAVYTNFIQSYLQDTGAHTFVLLFDRATPLPKYINEKANAKPTPFDQTGDPKTAWKRYFEKFYDSQNTDVNYMLNFIAKPTDKAPTPFNYELPEEWHNLLANRDFKEYVSWLICNGVFHFARIPAGKKLVVIGPDYGKQRIGDRVTGLDEQFQFEIYEADFAMPCFLRQMPEQNFRVFSIDGDVIVNLLYDRGNHVDARGTEPSFTGSLEVITKFNLLGYPEEYVDMNQLYLGVREYMDEITRQSPQRILIRYPVQTFCSVLILCGNDYVQNFPRIGPAKVFPAFEDTILKSHQTEFIYHANSPRSLQLNGKAYFSLMMNCYKRAYPRIQYPKTHSMQEIIETITPFLRKTNQEAGNTLTLPFVRNVIANLHWNLHYMVTSRDGERHNSATEVSKTTGAPLYGYRCHYKKTDFGTYQVTRPENTSLELVKSAF